MSEGQQIVIEDAVRFSESGLWQAQRSYYHQQGVDAWTDEVPFYVTSNPVIADKYARVTARFFQDWVNRVPETAHQTFYIVELGAGTGQFSFYYLKRITSLLERFRLSGVRFCYIMTDFTSQNIEFWKTHPVLKPYIAQGILDFAVLDFEKDQAITLIHAEKTLTANSLETPLTVIANYLFDSIVVDVFKVKEKKLTASLVTVKSTQNKDSDELWSQAHFSYTDHPIEAPYYRDPDINSVLMAYEESLQGGYLHFPIGGLQGLKQLAAISSGQLLLLTSDKGYSTLPELEDLDPPEIAFHGSFSLMVNYHAVGEYCRRRDGDVFHQPPFDSFSTSAFAIGFTFQDLPMTQCSLQDNMGEFCPGHYFHFYEQFEANVNSANLEYIASVLSFTHWDPEIFDLSHDRISDVIDGAGEDVVDYLSANLHRVVDHFYFTPGVNDTLFSVAAFYQEIGEYRVSAEYYEQSRLYFDDGFEVLLNLGDCYYELGQFELALTCLQQALTCQPHSPELLKMIRDVERNLESLSSVD